MKEEIFRQLELLNQNDKILNELYHSYAASVHLSDTAFWILYISWIQGDGCTQKEICDSWSYSRQTINTALKNLERQGILFLKTEEGNRKNKRIYFSPEGKAFADRVVAPFARAELLSLERLKKEERRLLTDLSEKRTGYFRQELEAVMAVEKREGGFLCRKSLR